MTIDLETRVDAWLAQARTKLDDVALGPQAEQIGRVEEVGDGIAIVSGLTNVRLDELLRFDKGQFGFVQVLERDRVGCVLLDDVDAIAQALHGFQIVTPRRETFYGSTEIGYREPGGHFVTFAQFKR